MPYSSTFIDQISQADDFNSNGNTDKAPYCVVPKSNYWLWASNMIRACMFLTLVH